jgi:hypothetical protein
LRFGLPFSPLIGYIIEREESDFIDEK